LDSASSYLLASRGVMLLLFVVMFVWSTHA
jgi:hypothetical protein